MLKHLTTTKSLAAMMLMWSFCSSATCFQAPVAPNQIEGLTAEKASVTVQWSGLPTDIGLISVSTGKESVSEFTCSTNEPGNAFNRLYSVPSQKSALMCNLSGSERQFQASMEYKTLKSISPRGKWRMEVQDDGDIPKLVVRKGPWSTPLTFNVVNDSFCKEAFKIDHAQAEPNDTPDIAQEL